MFQKWLNLEYCETRKAQDIPMKQLDIYIGHWISQLTLPNGQQYEPASIQAKLASLARYLREKKYTCNIMDETVFSYTAQAFKNKQESLREIGKGSRPNAAQPLSLTEEQILRETQMGTDDPQHLLNGLWYNTQPFFGQSAFKGAHMCLWGDIELKEENGAEYLEFNQRATRKKSGENNICCELCPKLSAAPELLNACAVRLYKEYKNRRPPMTLKPDSPFFLNINHQRRSDDKYWFKNQGMGEKLLSTMMRRMCENAGIEGKKTNYSLKKTSMQKRIKSGVPATDIMQLEGFKSYATYKKHRSELREKDRLGNCSSGSVRNRSDQTNIAPLPAPPTVPVLLVPRSSAILNSELQAKILLSAPVPPTTTVEAPSSQKPTSTQVLATRSQRSKNALAKLILGKRKQKLKVTSAKKIKSQKDVLEQTENCTVKPESVIQPLFTIPLQQEAQDQEESVDHVSKTITLHPLVTFGVWQGAPENSKTAAAPKEKSNLTVKDEVVSKEMSKVGTNVNPATLTSGICLCKNGCKKANFPTSRIECGICKVFCCVECNQRGVGFNAIQCERCLIWYCVLCANLGDKSVLGMIKKFTNVHWYCDDCDPVVKVTVANSRA